MSRILAYLDMILAEAEWVVARDRWMQRGDNKLWYIVTWGDYERKRLAYEYEVRLSQQAEDEAHKHD